MYPDNFVNCSLDELIAWRIKILKDLQQAEEQLIDHYRVDPEDLKPIRSIGKTLGKVEGEIQNRS
jgi:hypothetical protein